jgi:hypothetical protein
MWFTIVAFIVFVVSIYKVNTSGAEWWCLGVVLCGLTLFISLSFKLFEPMEFRDNSIEHAVVKEAYTSGISRDSRVDSAVALKVIEINSNIAKQQYWNSTIIGWWVSDGYDDLKLIK